MKKHIVCFGDSNTHGYCAEPFDCADGGDRFNESERWTCLLGQALGEDYLVLEEGLGGRTTVFQDPLTEGLCGIDVIFPVLMSHEPVDLLIVMLGTNDLLQGNSAEAVADRMENFCRQIELEKSKILLIGPPAMQMGEWVTTRELADASASLNKAYKARARGLGVDFVDAGDWNIPLAFDGVHFTEEGHREFAEALAEHLNKGV